MKPYRYQRNCLDALEDARRSGKTEALVVMACGLGKTAVVTLDVWKCLKCPKFKRVLYLCHQNEILSQASATFESVINGRHSIGFFTGNEKDYEANIVFASFQTIGLRLEEFSVDAFDYIVVDESHHSEAPTYRAVLDYFRPKFLIGVTATPNRKDDKDIRNIFGDPVFNLPLPKALAKGYLTPVDYRIVLDELDLSAVVEVREKRTSIAQLNRTLFIPKRDDEIARLIVKYLDQIKTPRVVIFCPSIRYCERLSKLLKGSLVIHSGVTDVQIKKRMEVFRSGTVNIILAVDYFNEGVDVPDANTLVFLRSTTSENIFYQQLGRGLRLSKGKKKVVVLDFVANFDRMRMIRKLDSDVKSNLKGDKVRDKHSPKHLPIEIDYHHCGFDEFPVDMDELILRMQEGFYSYEEAKEVACSCGWVNSVDYRSNYKFDPRLPAEPTKMYRDLWVSWNEFLGQKGFYSYEEAKEVARSKGWKSSTEYQAKCGVDPMLPFGPQIFYKDEWVSWFDFLGKDRQAKPYSYEEAMSVSRSYGWKNGKEYKENYKIDPRLRAKPEETYSGQWVSWMYFLTGVKFYTYEEARIVALKNGCKIMRDYKALSRKDSRLPVTASKVYKDQWVSWPEFLRDGS